MWSFLHRLAVLENQLRQVGYNLVGLGSEPLGGNIVCAYTGCQGRNILLI